MAPPSEGLSDDTASSLDDSAYEVLGDSTVLTSDDEDDRDDATDSMSSVGAHGPDDVTSLAGTEQSEETNFTGDQDEPSDGQDSALEPTDDSEDVHRSEATIRDVGPATDTVLKFDEPPCSSWETTTVTRTIPVSTEGESPVITRRLRRLPGQGMPTSASIRMTMAPESLTIDEPLRILYVGHASEKEEIIPKIATALAAPVMIGSSTTALHRPSSRYSVVPISSFGGPGAPEVELIDSVGIELVVDDCTSAYRIKVATGPDVIHLELNGNTSCRSRVSPTGAVFESRPAGSRRPHLAIICGSDADDMVTRQTCFYARSAMARHGVPTLLITSSPHHLHPISGWAIHPHSLHVHLEGPSAVSSTVPIVQRLAIDLPTFLAVDPRQLNRGIACMVRLHGGGAPDDDDDDDDDEDDDSLGPRKGSHPFHGIIMSAPDDVAKFSQRTAKRSLSAIRFRRRPGPGRRALVLLSVLFLCAVIGTTSTVLYQKLARTPTATGRGAHPDPILDAVQTPTTTMMTAVGTASRDPAPAAKPAGSTGGRQFVSVNRLSVSDAKKDLARWLNRSSTLTSSNRSDQFKMQIVGDRHLILRPPRRLASLKKVPSLSVTVRRRGEVLPVELSKLFEGVYAAKLRREDAWGVIDVIISTESKPAVAEITTLQADFGTPWSKTTEWHRAARDVAQRFQHGLAQVRSSLLPPAWAWMPPNAPVRAVGLGRSKVLSSWSHSSAWPPNLLRTAHEASSAWGKRPAVIARELITVVEQLGHLADPSRFFDLHLSRITDEMHRLTLQAHLARQRAVKTFTVARARRQARRIWARAWRGSLEKVRSTMTTRSTKAYGRLQTTGGSWQR